MKPDGKRTHAKAERRAGIQIIRELKEEAVRDQDFELGALYRDLEQSIVAISDLLDGRA